MMNHSTPNKQKTVHIIPVMCGLLYFVFTLSYLGIFQADLIEAVHGCLADWKTGYYPWLGAIGISVILYLLSMLLNMVTRWKGALYALSYIPAFLLLAPLTDVDHSIYVGNCFNDTWLWVVPLVLVAEVALSFLQKIDVKELKLNLSLTNQVNCNVTILCLMALFVLATGNTNQDFHNELAMDHAIREKQYVQATEVDASALEVSREMNALRAISLSHLDSLGSCLFKYPQYYHSDGLFFAEGKPTTHLTNRDIYAYLGGARKAGESTTAYLKRLCSVDAGCHTALDYYLCALLLDKQLDDFVKSVTDYGDEQQLDSQHYQEALILYKSMHPDYQLPFENAELEKKFEAFKKLEAEYADDEVARKNYTRRTYSDTYWWYYKYSE